MEIVVSFWGNIWSFYVDFAYKKGAVIVVVFLNNMGSAGVGELVVDELTDGGCFVGWDIAEVLVAFGVNDFDGVLPMNIVIKLVAAKITESWDFYNDTCKLSEDKGKHTGKPEVIRRYMDMIHFEEN